MQTEIVKIDAFQAARVVASVWTVLALFFAIVGLVAIAFGNEGEVKFDNFFTIIARSTDQRIMLFLLFPLLSYVVMYLKTAAFCLVYNFVAKHRGGIRFTTR